MKFPFEDLVAAEHLPANEVLRMLAFSAYFDLVQRPLPENRDGILDALAGDSLIRRCDAGGWNVTNFGAVLFAKRLEDFDNLRQKAVRIVQYRGTSRIETLREALCSKGYALGFESLIGQIDSFLPSNEVIEHGIRRTVLGFPRPAVRELVANALIHQDFFNTGTDPMVEIFEGRIEITNPGAPLVDSKRFVDASPCSRNESLALFMRRIGICEERGTGWEKVVSQSELFRLSAPLVETGSHYTRVVLFGPRPLSNMNREERIRALYLHACLKYVNSDYVTNSSVRQRFGIEVRNSARASRLIAEAIEARAVVPDDPSASRKQMRYRPWWTEEEA